MSFETARMYTGAIPSLRLEHVFPGGRIELLYDPDARGVSRPSDASIDRELLAAVRQRGVLYDDDSPSPSRAASEALRRVGSRATLLPVAYGARSYGVLLVRDVHLRGHALAQARRFADLLGHRLEAQRLAAELQHEQRLATLGTFAAALVHDLRTPLATVRLNMQLLARSATAGQRATLDDALLALDRVLDELSGTLDLAALARAAAASLEARARAQGVTLSLALSPDATVHVRGDRSRLLRALENLVRNALEVSTSGATITVDLVVDRDGASLTVADQGPGIDPALGERVFEPFVTTKREGVGLGLAIVRKVVEAHHGRVTMDSAIAAGTRMTVWLPLSSDRAGPLRAA